MVFTTAGGGASQLYPYEIDNSLRLTDNAYLNITRSSQSNTTGTFSAWIKTAAQNSFQLAGGHTDVNNRSYIYFPSSGDGFSGGIFSRTSGSADLNFSTSAVYRDPSAWYHLVIAIDTTQSTESNRVKWYVNGQQITSFSASTYPSQNASIPILNKSAQTIGAGFGASAVSEWSDGYMAEVYYIDGTQYAASDFGEYNDNGVWIPKDASDNLTFGTNGFYLEFKQTGTGQNSSGIGADTSGNDNHLAVNSLSATDVTTDTPTNNFATLNSVAPVGSYAEGNLRYTTSTTDGEWSTSTISISTNGKWYCEVKAISKTAGAGIYYQVGVTKGNASDFTYRALYRSDGAIYVGGSNTATFSSYTDNDIISIAYDSSNRNVTFYKNGNSEGTVTAPSLPSTSDDYFFGASSLSGGNTFITEWNFGNAPFTISSGNSDANGYGNFEYAVPSGYYSLCTKNLAEYG